MTSRSKPQYIPIDMSEKTVVVTGANTGIGLWTALGLAKANATVLLVCRNAQKGKDAQDFIARQTHRAKPSLFLADFADLNAVNTLANELSEAAPALHVLINNAGLFSPKRAVSKDGYELTFAVNHLAPFLLTNRLLSSLERGGLNGTPSRIVTVSSAAARKATLNFDDMMAEKRYGLYSAYSQSKLANILFTKELARRLSGKPITANCLHPGIVSTDIGSKGGIAGAVWGMIRPFMLTAQQGAVNSLYVATDPELNRTSGVFFVRQKPETPNAVAQDPNVAARLWHESERLIDKALQRPTLNTGSADSKSEQLNQSL